MINIKGGFIRNPGDLPISLGQIGMDHDDVHIRCPVDERIFLQERAGEIGADQRAVFPGPLLYVTLTQFDKLFPCYFHNLL